MSLSSTITEFWICIRKNVEFSKGKISAFCEKQEPKIFAFIEHKGDISVETGLVEGVHYHIYLQLSKKCRIQTMYNRINKHFGFSNSNGIRVEKAESYEGCIQYLIHRNNPNKTKHDKSEIVSNIDSEELSIILEKESDSLTFQKIYNLCLSSNSILDVIQAVGFTRYNLYRNTIQDIYKATKTYRLKCDI